MSTAEATQREASRDDRGASARSRVPPSSPLLTASWLLRAAALAASLAAAAGVIVAPGMRGNASEPVVVDTDRASAALASFLVGLLVALALWGALELGRVRGGLVTRMALIAGGATVVAVTTGAMFSRELSLRLPPVYAVTVSSAAAVAAIAAAYTSAHAPQTRAVAAVLLAFALAAVARVAAWELATAAGDRASMQLFNWSRVLATTGVLLEAAGQLIAVTWLATRSRLSGQLGSFVALAMATALTWGVARGVRAGAPFWQVVMHTALADAAGVPAPYGLNALATLLVPTSLLLALVAASQPKQVAAVVAAMSLALVSRGSFDAPLRALCAVVASFWTTLASGDERAMWRTLIDDRKRRLEEE
jgi:hypothetical protein